MGKFSLQAIKEKLEFKKKIREQVFGNIASVSLSMLLPRLDKIIKGLNETLSTNVLNPKTFADLDSLYLDQCVNNKSIKNGGYVGDKYLFNKMIQHYPEFKANKDMLTSKELLFIQDIIIPFIESLKTQLTEQMFNKAYGGNK